VNELWYYEDAGRQAGPVTDGTLKELIRFGRLAAGARVWRAGMDGWRRWEEVPELKGLAGPPPAPPVTVTPGRLERVGVGPTVLLTVVTFGVWGVVKFYQCGKGYEAAVGRNSRFETWFWAWVSLFVGSMVLSMVAGPLGIAAFIASVVVGFLLLTEVLGLREAVQGGEVPGVWSATVHKVLWLGGSILSWVFIGVVALVNQAAKFFDDHDKIVEALEARAARGPLPTTPVSAAASSPPATPSPIATPAGSATPTGTEGAVPADPPAPSACSACGAPLPAEARFCNRCGAPTGGAPAP
jgi:hypothetical protein